MKCNKNSIKNSYEVIVIQFENEQKEIAEKAFQIDKNYFHKAVEGERSRILRRLTLTKRKRFLSAELIHFLS